MMYEALEAVNILRENASPEEQYDLSMLLETAKPQVHSSLLGTLYKQINEYRKINYDIIDASKGNYKNLSFYDDLEKTHGFLKDEIGIGEDLDVIVEAKRNVQKMKHAFEEGYKLDSDVVILLYETTVHAIVDATSVLITVTATSVVKTKEACSRHSLNMLKRFNKAVTKGSLQKAVITANEQAFLDSGAKTVAKEEVLATALSALVGAGLILAFIPLIRLLVFYFYYTRMRISDYLDQLSMYIKINEVEVRSDPEFDEAKKKDIIEKQNKWIERLDSLSDKIRVNQSRGEKEAKEQIKEENAKVTVRKIKDDVASTEPTQAPQGFDF